MDRYNLNALLFASFSEFPGVILPQLQLPPLPGVPGKNLHGATA